MDYEAMLKKGYEKIPESALKGERFEIPKAKGHIQGNKTVITNFQQICKTLGRDKQHILKFILRELATPAESKGSNIVFGRKVSAARVNETIEKYANTYVLCKTCGKPDTKIIKKERIDYLKCMACGAQSPIKS
ncbi:MAG: translation initiation factor IF-2 subunit beta [Candidatus Woesearchaeota archaeon]